MRFLLAGLLLLTPALAWAQQPPSGQATLNQGYQARAVTPSDTAFITQTRGLFIGAASACTLSLVLNGDTSAVTFTNVQSGQILPLSVIQVKAASTCTGIVALY